MATTIGSLDLSALNSLYDETQYFWFESSAQPWGAGAHVTLYPQSEFTTSTHANYLKGQNILMNTDGFSIRNGTLPMMTLDNDSLDFNVVDTTNQTYTNVATFGTERVVLWGGNGVLQVDPTFSHAPDLFGISGVNGTYVGTPWSYYSPNVGAFVWCAQQADDEDETNTYDQFIRIGARTATGGLIGGNYFAGIECVASYTNSLSYITMDAGNVSLSDSGDVEFQGDITVAGHSTPIGDFNTYSNTKSISTGTSYITSGVSVTLGYGVYALVGQAEFASNSTGRRGVVWQTGSGNVSGTAVNQTAVSGATTRIQSVCIAYPQSSDGVTYTLYVAQNSGSSLSTDFYVRVVRIA